MTRTAPLTATHRATRDEVLASRTASLAGYSVTSDTGASYAVLGPVAGDPDRVYAQGRRHGNLVLVTRTGTVSVRGHGAQVRVRIDFATDTGDLAGTLAFGPNVSAEAACRTGGVAPRVLFG
jgi:hypothetical protein